VPSIIVLVLLRPSQFSGSWYFLFGYGERLRERFMKRKRKLSFDEQMYRYCKKWYRWTRKEYRQWQKDLDVSPLEAVMDKYIKEHRLNR
jgi:hypothetical protein